MDLREAYKILELNEGASDDDVKKQFRKLAAKYHPDINKDPGAEEMSKKISEAYNTIKNPPKEAFPGVKINFDGSDQFDHFTIFNHIHQQFFQREPPPTVEVTVSFPESVLGCSKKIDISRYVACEVCGGNRKTAKDCKSCEGRGKQKSISTFNVKIPGGVTSDMAIRLGGAGHFEVNGYGTAFVKVKVQPDKEMELYGNDVISSVKVSFLESLTGATKKVNTVYGEKDITINPRSRHKDQVILPRHGSRGLGNHVFLLDVDLPDRADEIINLLKEKDDNSNVL